MKKLLPLMALPFVYVSSAQADFLRVEAGVGSWNSDPSGSLQYDDSVDFDVADVAGFDAETNAYAWAYFKHFVPLVPNVRLEYASPSFEGSTATNPDVPANVHNELVMNQFDTVLYYNLLDNTLWATLDLGLDIKLIDGSYKIEGGIVDGGSVAAFDQDFSLVMPLLYARVRAELPLTDLAVEAIARGVSYSDNTVVDAFIKLDYTMSSIPIVQPGFELGYRYQQMKLDASALDIDGRIDTQFSGLYAGVMLRF